MSHAALARGRLELAPGGAGRARLYSPAMGTSSAGGLPSEIDPVGRWQPGPLEPPPLDAALHVWRVRLTAVDDRVLSTLGDDERERAARIVAERPRELWMRSRGVLRELLGRYSSADPRAIVLSTGAHGKPALASARIGDRQSAGGLTGGAAEAELAFNLSHSGEPRAVRVRERALGRDRRRGSRVRRARAAAYAKPITWRSRDARSARPAPRAWPSSSHRCASASS